MLKPIITLSLLLAGLVGHAQTFKLQYSFEAFGDALFFRYDPTQNSAMSSYVESIQDWTQLVSKEDVDIDEIYRRLTPKFMTVQGRLAGNVHLVAPHLRITAGVSTGRYEFRNYSWHGDALFTYNFKESMPKLTVEAGYMMFLDRSFGPEAAIKSAADTPKEIKQKMRRFMTEKMFEKPVSKGLKVAAYYNITGNIDIGVNYFADFVKRYDGARNDYASLTLRVRLEETPNVVSLNPVSLLKK